MKVNKASVAGLGRGGGDAAPGTLGADRRTDRGGPNAGKTGGKGSGTNGSTATSGARSSAQPTGSSRGVCYDFLRGACSDPCPRGYEHRQATRAEIDAKSAGKGARARGRTPARATGGNRSRSGSRSRPLKPRNEECRHFRGGTCAYGMTCAFVHPGHEREQQSARDKAAAAAKAPASQEVGRSE